MKLKCADSECLSVMFRRDVTIAGTEVLTSDGMTWDTKQYESEAAGPTTCEVCGAPAIEVEE